MYVPWDASKELLRGSVWIESSTLRFWLHNNMAMRFHCEDARKSFRDGFFRMYRLERFFDERTRFPEHGSYVNLSKSKIGDQVMQLMAAIEMPNEQTNNQERWIQCLIERQKSFNASLCEVIGLLTPKDLDAMADAGIYDRTVFELTTKLKWKEATVAHDMAK